MQRYEKRVGNQKRVGIKGQPHNDRLAPLSASKIKLGTLNIKVIL